ncbi:hypothetical protein OS493_019934 [Desmophyllum pertusum]|uniref:Uncharacterized protein n=1 Tax=Desmophyllum pertusum TaxID=174260 RepID=A0A9W9YN11_9CNID|nr:hypothetical protein OS493_019934 [Desmophyllum pertusum]
MFREKCAANGWCWNRRCDLLRAAPRYERREWFRTLGVLSLLYQMLGECFPTRVERKTPFVWTDGDEKRRETMLANSVYEKTVLPLPEPIGKRLLIEALRGRTLGTTSRIDSASDRLKHPTGNAEAQMIRRSLTVDP